MGTNEGHTLKHKEVLVFRENTGENGGLAAPVPHEPQETPNSTNRANPLDGGAAEDRLANRRRTGVALVGRDAPLHSIDGDGARPRHGCGVGGEHRAGFPRTAGTTRRGLGRLGGGRRVSVVALLRRPEPNASRRGVFELQLAPGGSDGRCSGVGLRGPHRPVVAPKIKINESELNVFNNFIVYK